MAKGLLIVFTGDGKGKTTAALGMAIRAAGHGLKILILQFIKGGRFYGELKAMEKLEAVTIKTLGSGFTWEKEDLTEDRRLAEEGWKLVEEELSKGDYDMLILDELNVVLHYGLLPLEPVLAALEKRLPQTHVVITGRDAPSQLLEIADLVTEMRNLKHPYHEKGVRAQRGIEF